MWRRQRWLRRNLHRHLYDARDLQLGGLLSALLRGWKLWRDEWLRRHLRLHWLGGRVPLDRGVLHPELRWRSLRGA
jgi:hypothetical protein